MSLADFIGEEHKRKFDYLFTQADSNNDGFVDGGEAVAFLKNSQLPNEKLAKIWALSDLDKDGKLDRTEFRLSMHLVYACLSGASFDDLKALPEKLITSAKSELGSLKNSPISLPATPPLIQRASLLKLHEHSDSMEELDSIIKKTTANLNDITPTDSPVSTADQSRKQAAELVKNSFESLEAGQFFIGLTQVDRALELLAPYSTQRQKEIAICNLYKHAFRLLIAIDWCDEHNERPFKAILSRFLADLSLQPKHRVIAMRMAITNNLQSQNYGVAAKFIRQLLPLELLDSKLMESRLRLCQENQYSDKNLMKYVCSFCKNEVSGAPLTCSVCGNPISDEYYLKLLDKKMDEVKAQEAKELAGSASDSSPTSQPSSTVSSTVKSLPPTQTETSTPIPTPTPTPTPAPTVKPPTLAPTLSSLGPPPPMLTIPTTDTSSSTNKSQGSENSSSQQPPARAALNAQINQLLAATAEKQLQEKQQQSLPPVQPTQTQTTNETKKARSTSKPPLPEPPKKHQTTTADKEKHNSVMNHAVKSAHEKLQAQKNSHHMSTTQDVSPMIDSEVNQKKFDTIKHELENILGPTETSFGHRKTLRRALPVQPISSATTTNAPLSKANQHHSQHQLDEKHASTQQAKQFQLPAVKGQKSQEENGSQDSNNNTTTTTKPRTSSKTDQTTQPTAHHAQQQPHQQKAHHASIPRRDEIAAEILSSERKYVQSLDLLVNLWYKPMQHLPENVVSKQQVKTIFSTIEIIHNYNSWFLTRIEERITLWDTNTQKLGDVFLELADFFKMYTSYVNSYPAAIVTVSELKNKSLPFAEFIASNTEKCKGLDLASFLIQPIQRLPRYVLLLQDLVKHTDQSHLDYADLERALERMKLTANYINEKRREAENMSKVVEIAERLVYPNDVQSEPLLQPHRRFIMKGKLGQVHEDNSSQTHDRICLLFNDIFLICRPVETGGIFSPVGQTRKRSGTVVGANVQAMAESQVYEFHKKVPLGVTIVSTVPERPTAFRLTASKAKEYIYVCATEQERDDWIREIQKCISTYQEAESARFEQLRQNNAPGTTSPTISTNSGDSLPSTISSANDELDDDDWGLVFTNSQTQGFNPGQMILSETTTNLVFFRIIKGQVSCEHKGVPLFQIGEGQVFGYDAFFGRFVPSWSVRASGDSELVLNCIEVSFIARLLRLDSALALKFYRTLAVNLARELRALETHAASKNQPPESPSQSRASLPVLAGQGNTNNNTTTSNTTNTKPTEKVVDKSLEQFRKVFPDLQTDRLLKSFQNVTYNRVLKYSGDLFVTSHHMCFYSKVFGVKKQKELPLTNISAIVKSDTIPNAIAVTKQKIGSKDPVLLLYIFKNKQECDLGYQTLHGVWTTFSKHRRTLSQEGRKNSQKYLEQDLPSKEDWELILKNARQQTYEPDEKIVNEGEFHTQRISQIISGECRIERIINGVSEVMKFKMSEGDMFGEISFLQGGAASASVIAQTKVELSSVDAYSIKVLAELKPGLAGRFYKYIASIIRTRITNKLLDLHKNQ